MNEEIIYGYIPPILHQKGYTEIECISSYESQNVSSVYKVNKPGIGYWVVKRVSKEFAILYRAEKIILTTLKHDFLPIVYEVFEDDKSLYIAMEFIPGQSFEQLINSKKKVTEVEARRYFVQLCELFGYLHSNGVVHKDCEPSNIMLSEHGNIYVIDFGVSKSGKYSPASVSQNYASPEQMADPSIGNPRTEIYSLGATMYSLLTKAPPTKENDGFKAMANKLSKRTDISLKLRRIILKCMSSKPVNRYRSMWDVKSAIEKKDWVWKIAVAISFMLVSTAITIFGFITWTSETTDSLIPRGDHLVAEGTYDLALSHYENYILRRPTSPYGYERHRRLLVHKGQYIESLVMFNANETILFDYFISRDGNMDFRNTWISAVSGTIQYLYNLQQWEEILELLMNPRVQGVLDIYRHVNVLAQIYVHLEEWESAIYHYLQLLQLPWEDVVEPATHIQNLLNGASVARNDRYHFLSYALDTAHIHSDPMLSSVYSLILGYYFDMAESHYVSGELQESIDVINIALQKYPIFRQNFDMLNMRAILTFRQLLQAGESSFLQFAEYAWDALEAASSGNEDAVYELRNLLNTLAYSEVRP